MYLLLISHTVVIFFFIICDKSNKNIKILSNCSRIRSGDTPFAIELVLF